jgi:hypothetical protein
LSARLSTQDEFGEEVELWDKLAFRLSASVSPVRGEERFTSEQSVARQVEFRARYSADIADLSLLDRIVYPPFSSDASGAHAARPACLRHRRSARAWPQRRPTHRGGAQGWLIDLIVDGERAFTGIAPQEWKE